MSSSEFANFSNTMREAVTTEMQTLLRFGDTGEHLFGMMHYHLGWVNDQFQPHQGKRGKQIRPTLLLLATAAAGAHWRSAVPAAAGIELLHNFSLIHDDIEDNSPTRHGRPTLWTVWGIPLAINAGDAMFSVAHQAFQGLLDRGVPPEVTLKCLGRFDDTCLRLTQGQHQDMHFETRSHVTVDEYIKMITGKTSILLSLCAELGARIAQRSDSIIDHYAQFGLNLGLAFQVLDDVLGIWGDEADIGKSATSDIVTRKKTLPVLFGLAEDHELQRLYNLDAEAAEGTPDRFVPAVIKRLDACGARTYAEAEAQKYTDLALSHLEEVNPQGEAGAALSQLTHLLLNRKN